MIYFVTGGSRGIGAAIVLQAIEEGHDVGFTFVSKEEQAKEVVERAKQIRPEARCKCYRMDVRDPDDVDRVGNQFLDDFESIDVVVNNAGVNRDNLAVSMSNEEWNDVIATNLSGPFFVTRQFLTTMLANRFGRIINISSVSARGATGQANYAAAKSGLIGFTKTLAKEYGPKNITTNVVMVGFFETEMTREHLSQSNRDFWMKYCPKRRIGELPELSKIITFLASEAATFINGEELWVTGGLDYAP
ncbi:MAG: SDR family oxidoreductase [Pseudomonadota bacterium]